MELHSRCLFFFLGIYNQFSFSFFETALEKPSFSGHVVLEGQTSSPPHAQVHSDLIRDEHMAQICPGRARPGPFLLQLMGKKHSFSTEAVKWSTAYKLRVSVGWERTSLPLAVEETENEADTEKSRCERGSEAQS